MARKAKTTASAANRHAAKRAKMVAKYGEAQVAMLESLYGDSPIVAGEYIAVNADTGVVVDGPGMAAWRERSEAQTARMDLINLAHARGQSSQLLRDGKHFEAQRTHQRFVAEYHRLTEEQKNQVDAHYERMYKSAP